MARSTGWALLLGLMASLPARVDAADGQLIYRQTCARCHGGPLPAGPSLKGIVGRKAGTLPGYSYSKALEESAIVWTPANLNAWLTNPHQVAPGEEMPCDGLPDAADREAVIGYLKSR